MALSIRAFSLCLALLLTIILAGQVHAQSGEEGEISYDLYSEEDAASGSGTDGTSGPSAPPGISISVGSTATPTGTDSIVAEIGEAGEFCGRIERVYVVDCLSERLAAVAAALPETGDYADAKKALDEASRSLSALVADNRDPSGVTGVARSTGADGTASLRPLRPVSEAAAAATIGQALAVLEEAETALLRSAENSSRRSVHYQRIAEAIGSNKVLLRST